MPLTKGGHENHKTVDAHNKKRGKKEHKKGKTHHTIKPDKMASIIPPRVPSFGKYIVHY